jgi:hypothetical protein
MNVTRRRFLHGSAVASSVAAVTGFGFEERNLLAQADSHPASTPPNGSVEPMPRGKLGKIEVSRLICGGNLISGFAHSRDLIYVSALLKQYFTDDKVCDTLALCETHGINTAILRVDDNTLRILGRYRKERAGRIQWIAQAKITDQDTTDIRRAIDGGAVGVYVHGGVGDSLVAEGRVDVLGRALDLIRQNKVLAGIAGHALAVPQACERAGLEPDFYLKTFNSKRYWSAGPMPRMDSVWEETPEDTEKFMATVDRPWIAYKVLGAGAIHPREGFQFAFEHGADFLCVGMFDFQVAEDVALARRALDKARIRPRPWSA